MAQLGWILPEAGAREVMLEEGAEMIGNLFLLLAMTLHARYVILDAEGLLPHREETEDVYEEDAEEEYEYEYEEDEVEAEASGSLRPKRCGCILHTARRGFRAQTLQH